MPTIEVLPNTTASAPAPGWAYVPDTGYDPSKAPLIPPANRKRARNATQTTSADVLSARQATALQRRLNELDKDNHRDTRDIAIPAKKSSGGARGGAGTGRTPATKKILISAKTFAHHIEDEEAALARGGDRGSGVSTPTARPPVRASKTPIHRRASLLRHESSASVSTPTTGGLSPSPLSPATPGESGMPPPPLPVRPQVLDLSTAAESMDVDADPLLKSEALPMPTEAELEALLNAPPLSYSAARAGPPAPGGPPQRHFCEMCGYWGRVKCMACGTRVCGLGCKKEHEGSGRCVRF
ncbi:hypothetical protein H2201_003398 [Coniosporium apollinis]|uniref:HIT-type domain-containing protein n=2 Tax=Coniosporium TaxID=2810619 RepID=A0ABQ9NXN9_9PEZI|nr:hypothetical protein H2199_002163 [Cladosporium sp. JES 115]KAJ9666476.1 hypothetical protein H2201_003398 [Coniosporium apollinis]